MVRLGNIRKPFQLTTHNIPFQLLYHILQPHQFTLHKQKFKRPYTIQPLNPQKLLFIHPITIINLSPQPLPPLIHYYNLHLQHFILLYHHLHLQQPQLR
ncbi:aminoacyl-tRNA hydrolase family protein, partial [Staphylococcus epidermidis]